MDWSDVLKLALSIFLIVTGLGLAYLFLRMAGVFERLGSALTRITDEVVPILSRAQTTVDGINLELERVDEIMVSAVNATKGAEKTVTSISNAVAAPAKKASGLAAAAKEALATFKARRAAGPDTVPDPPTAPAPPAPAAASAPADAAHNGSGSEAPADPPPELRNRARGPSMSQISWALPKHRA